ncbi:MAG: methyltransferase domain-containing protein [Oscillospiraceae bacterium]|nr:methyltransferase domain-containing protein [Oscillospiraceae bacterium]
MTVRGLICPVCGEALSETETGLVCPRRHGFDRARQGYVNLLRGGRPGGGDSREMARARRAFLEKGYYAPLVEAVGDQLALCLSPGATVLDVCCGEGWYTAELSRRFPEATFCGFDLSKEMVRLAAARRCGAFFFTANVSAVPMASGSADTAVHLFAPFHGAELSRLLAPGGTLISVLPGRDHLMGLKQVLYDRPVPNDEAEPDPGALTVVRRVRVRTDAVIRGREDVGALLAMTPYAWRTPRAGKERLALRDELSTPLDFVLLVMKKEN